MNRDDAGANPPFFSFEEIHSFTEEHLNGARDRKPKAPSRPDKPTSVAEEGSDHELKFPKRLLKNPTEEANSSAQEKAPAENNHPPLSRHEIAGLEAALRATLPDIAATAVKIPAKKSTSSETGHSLEAAPVPEPDADSDANKEQPVDEPPADFQATQYDRRFASMRREMERMATDLRLTKDSVSEFKKMQAKQIDDLKRDVRHSYHELQQHIQQLEDKVRTSENLLQKLLTKNRQQEMFRQELLAEAKEMNMASTRQTRELRALKVSLDEQQTQTERKLDTLKREMRRVEDDVRDELRRSTERLGHQKIDRNVMALILMEMAGHLETGSGVSGLLEGAVAPDQD